MLAKQSQFSGWIRKYWLVILGVIGFLIYFQSFSNKFVWDDEEQIIENQVVHSLDHIPSYFVGSSFNSGGGETMHGIYYKPLMTTVYAVLWYFFGSDPTPYHVFQLFVHIFNSALVVSLFCFFLNFSSAFFLGLVFLVHPINSECVLYCANFQDVMFLFFGLVALNIVVQKKIFFETIYGWIIVTVILLAALLSKESGLLFLPVTVVYAYLFSKESLKRVNYTVSVSFVIYCILRFGIAGLTMSSGTLPPISRLSFGERLLTFPKVFVFYIKQTFFPMYLAISQHWVVKEASVTDFFVPLVVTLLIVAAMLFGLRYTKDKKYLFFLFWFVVGMGLHAQLVPLDLTVAERWFYFPLIGLLGMIALFFESFFAKKPRGIIWLFPVILIILMSVRSFDRSFDWRDGLTLFSHDVEINPGAYDLQNNVGVELFRTGRIAQAKGHFEESIRLVPDWWTSWNNLGVAYEFLGDLNQAEAIYREVIATSTYYRAYENYFKILARTRRFNEAKEFVENKALKVFPNNPLFVRWQEFYNSF